MWLRRNLLLVALTTFLRLSQGCQMDGLINWNIPISRQIQDVYRGSIFSAQTSNILSINNINVGGGLNGGPYVAGSLSGSTFDLSTNDAFENYEEYETAQSMTLTVTFQCTGGSTASLIIIIGITDTNNNAPLFRPSNEYSFTVATPIPPGFLITGCLSDIVVRDIDLTTQRIEFEIEENDYFEIIYDAASSTTVKEFRAAIRSKTLIRSLPEITLTITATDVDLTGDPPITSDATVRIQGDTEFELPPELIFSQPFYLASYTATDEIDLEQLISLKQGYHEDVQFTLEGDYNDYFELVTGTNEMLLRVITPLSQEDFWLQRIILVIRAEREYTSGATATVIIQLPEVSGVEFSAPQYAGSIVDNELQTLELTLASGYENGIEVVILGEHSSFFTSTVAGNTITLIMSTLDANIIDANNFITLQVLATDGFSSATTIVTLGIIKDDVTTPTFEKVMYSGTYDIVDGLTLGQIGLVQGYDENVLFELEGDFKQYFEMEIDREFVRLKVSTLPVDVLIEHQLLLVLRANKPRTVGAACTIAVSLPEARRLKFDAPTYSGTLQDNELTLNENIILSVGYDKTVNFDLSGDFSSYFTAVSIENQISINLTTPLPENIIKESAFILLTLTASGIHAVTTSTSVGLEIIKQDTTTPVFARNIYRARYVSDEEIDFGSTFISLAQGFDREVSFKLDGEHSEYFEIESNFENNMTLSVKSEIPVELIYEEKVFIFNIIAERALTVGSNAAISIEFPRELTQAVEMRFAKQTYIGSLEDGNFSLEEIILESGYAAGTNFTLLGDHSSYFTTIYTNNVVTILLNTGVSLPDEVLSGAFVLLELEAQRVRAITTVISIVIDIKKREIIVPEFSNDYYRGSYTASGGLIFNDVISLAQGYDDTVEFKLEGESSVWFEVEWQSNEVSLVLKTPLPEEVINSNNQLLFTVVAVKSFSVNGTAVISIDLPREIAEPSVLRFEQNNYVGHIDNGKLDIPTIILLSNDLNPTLNISGDYAMYFELLKTNSNISLQIIEELPPTIIEENSFIVLEISATHLHAISGYTTLVLEIVKTKTVPPIFEQAYYVGNYSERDGLLFTQSMQLIQGFDASVNFTLAGDDSVWFELVNNESSLSLRIVNDTINEVKDRSHLVFRVVANKTTSVPGEAAIIISITDFYNIDPLYFSQNYFLGYIENGILNTDPIVLEGDITNINTIILSGDHVEHFNISQDDGIFTLQLLSDLPVDVVNNNTVLIFNLQVETERYRAHTTIIIELIKPEIIPLAFDEDFYVGSYSEGRGFIFESQITLVSGYDETVSFSLEGESSQWFEKEITGNTVTLTVPTPIPTDVLVNRQQFVFVIRAQKVGSPTATASIIVEVVEETTELTVLSFAKFSYVGSIIENEVKLETIELSQGYSENVTYSLRGELNTYFRLSYDGANVNVTLLSDISEEIIPENRIILLELQAVAPFSISAIATIVLKVEIVEVTAPVFEEIYYVGLYSIEDGLVFENPMKVIAGDEETVQFRLGGAITEWFALEITSNSAVLISIKQIPSNILTAHQFLTDIVIAENTNAASAKATVIVELFKNETENGISFEKILYEGSIEDGVVQHDTITVFGYEGNDVQIIGEYSGLFQATLSEGNVIIRGVGLTGLSPDVSFVALELRVGGAGAVLLLDVKQSEEPQENVTFDKTFYEGTIEDGVVIHETITVTGYSGTDIHISGDHSELFTATLSTGIVTIVGETLENLPTDVLFVTIQMRVDSASAMLLLTVKRPDPQPEIASFDQSLYRGIIRDGIVQHDSITVSGYTGTNLTILGDYTELFEATLTNGVVTIQGVGLNNLPLDVSFVAFEMRVSTASAMLILTVERTEPPVENVSFDKTVYEGSIQNGVVQHETITVEGYSGTSIQISGEYSQFFTATLSNGIVTIQGAGLENLPPGVSFVVIELSVSDASATLVLGVDREDTPPGGASFDRLLYEGTIRDGVVEHQTITVSQYTGTTIEIIGEHAALFDATLTGGIVTIQGTSLNNLPLDVSFVTLEMRVSTATSVLVLKVERTEPPEENVSFDKIAYKGSIQNGVVQHETITVEGYSGTNIQISGVYSQYFTATLSNGIVTIQGSGLENLPSDVLFLVIELTVSDASATLVLAVDREDTPPGSASFDRLLYEGTIRDGVVEHQTITVSQYTGTTIEIIGEHAALFDATLTGGIVTIQGTNLNNLPSDVSLVTLEMRVSSASAMLVLLVERTEPPVENVSFDKTVYEGSIQNGVVQHETITVDGYSGISIQISGEYSQFFTATLSNGIVTIQGAGLENLPSDVLFVVIELSVSDASATLVLAVDREDPPPGSASFDRLLYEGTIRDGVVHHQTITVSQYTGTTIEIIGEHAALFDATLTSGIVTIQGRSLNNLPLDVSFVTLEMRVSTAISMLVLTVERTEPPVENISFDKTVYEGTIQNGVVQHESITVDGYSGTNIQISGVYSQFFTASLSNGIVTIQGAGLENLPSGVLFVVIELSVSDASATLVLAVDREVPPPGSVSFDRLLYEGTIQNGVVQHESITVTQYTGTTIEIIGEYAELFEATLSSGSVTIQGVGLENLPSHVSFVTLEMRVSTASAILVLKVDDTDPPVENVSFDKSVYEGSVQDGVVQHETITVSGYSGTSIRISGAHSSFFEATLSGGTVIIQGIGLENFPSDVTFVVIEMAVSDANAVLVLTVERSEQVVTFEKNFYEGLIQNGAVEHESIIVSGYDGTEIILLGEFSEMFMATLSNGVITIRGTSLENLPSDIFFVTLEMRVSTASAVLVLAVNRITPPPPENINFDKTLYGGTIQDGVVQHEAIIVSGYTGTSIQIKGEYMEFFDASLINGVVTIKGLELEILPPDVSFVAIEINVVDASAVLVLTVTNDDQSSSISFEKTLYKGTIEGGIVQHETISVTGYSGTVIEILGGQSELFEGTVSNGIVTIQGVNLGDLPYDIFFVALELRINDVSAVLVLTIKRDEPPPQINFDKTLYEGTIANSIVEHETITVLRYTGTTVSVSGEYAQFFQPTILGGVVNIVGVGLENLPSHVLFVALEVRASSATAMLVLTVEQSEVPPEDVTFDRTVYEGTIEDGVVVHDSITVTGYSGTEINVIGEFSDLFEASIQSGTVTVRGTALDKLPEDVSFVALQLQVSNVSAMLVLTVQRTVIPVEPIVKFSSESYTVRVDITQTGVVGRVLATADNGEDIAYSLDIDDEHLKQRLTVDSNGGLFLSAPANSGVYSFQAVATAVVSQVDARAQIYMTVEAITTCGDDNLVLPPLIIIDRDEEEPHQNLVVLNATEFPGCRYSLSNRWPLDQTWLYVDENGLHAHSIDREDDSIAFMALSQVQVELILECDTDEPTRHKRSLKHSKLDHLGPYDYGNNKWILTDNILYSSRRSLVNLIVNDINDNAPIFIGKENEPFVVGYPVPDLEERVLPRALAEVQATDADVGENSKLIYWSSNEVLAVARGTGFVHVRDNKLLEDNMVLTVNATDRNGVDGLTGSIQLMVKLVDANHIAVITVKDAFLDDEPYILSNLTDVLGYEVRALRSTVVPDGIIEDGTRKKRYVENVGASLQLYVYALIDREPVDVNQLTGDISSITTSTITVIRTVTLEDYLDGLETRLTQNTTGLLVSTIVLSVLLFIMIVAAGVWFFLKRRKLKNYEQFSDTNSIASQSYEDTSRPKPEELTRQRLDIESLKKSERRLQEMLEAPMEEVTVEASSSGLRAKHPDDNVPIVVSNDPIVIQSIDKLKDGGTSDDEDEFGERKTNRRKSIVTFNENVEKIIHVENTPDDNSSLGDFEVYKF